MGRDPDGNLRAADPRHHGKWIGVGMILGSIVVGVLLAVTLIDIGADGPEAWLNLNPRELFGLVVATLGLAVTGVWKIRDSMWRNRLSRPPAPKRPS